MRRLEIECKVVSELVIQLEPAKSNNKSYKRSNGNKECLFTGATKAFRSLILALFVLSLFWVQDGFAAPDKAPPLSHPNALTDLSQVKPNSFKIGVIMPAQAFPELASEFAAVVDIAMKEVNARGGILGQPVQAILMEDFRDPKVSIEVAQFLQDVVKVDGIIGPTSTSRVKAVAPFIKIPIVSPNATGDDLNRQADNVIWRLMASNSRQAKQISNFVSYMGMDKVAIFYVDSAYGQGFAKKIKKSFSLINGEVVATFPIRMNKKLAKKTIVERLDEVFAANPNGILVAMSRNEFQQVADVMKDRIRGSNIKYFLATGSLYGAGFSTHIPKEILACQYFSLPIPSSSSLRIIKSSLHRYRVKLEAYETPYVYDAMYLLMYARLLQKTNQVATLKEGLNRVSSNSLSGSIQKLVAPLNQSMDSIPKSESYSFEGITGQIVFDAQQDNSKAQVGFWSYQNGKMYQSTRRSNPPCN